MGSRPSSRWVVVGILAAVGIAACLFGLRACAEDPDGDGLAGARAGLADNPAGRDASAVGDTAQSDPDARARSAGRRAKSATEDAPDVAPTVTGTLRVVVVAAADGTPVAGAEVTLHPGSPSRRVATTDARGSAVLPFHATDGGQCDVRVRVRGFLAFYKSVVESEGEERSVEARLERGAVVEVTLLEPEGLPVADAEIGLSAFLNEPEDWTTTDVDGSAVLTVAPETAYGLCVPSPEGFVRWDELIRSGAIGGPPVRHVVRLERAVRIVGAVTRPDGAFVPAIVSVRREGSGTSSESMRCDADGKFEIENLRGGRTWVVVASAGGWSDSEPVRAVAVGSDEFRADPVLRPPSAVVVRLVDDSGASLGGEQVTVLHSGEVRFRAAGGTEHRVEAQPGPCVVFAAAEGRVPVEVSKELVAGETWIATIRFVVGVSLSGVVEAPDGASMNASVSVRVVPARTGTASSADAGTDFDLDSEFSWIARTRTDGGGRFALAGLPPGRHEVRVSPFHGFEEATFPAVTAPAEGLRFTVERSSRLRFPVRFEGDPAAAYLPANVDVDGTTTADARWSVHRSRLRGDDVYEFEIPRDARPEVTIGGDGYVPVVVEAPVPRGEVLEIPPVRLVPGVAVTGTLRRPNGHPVRHATIRVTQQCRPPRMVSAQASDDGGFAFAGLAPGRALVEAMPDEGPSATFDVEVGSGRPLDLTLPPFGVVWLRVAAPDGGPEAGVVVSALGPDGRPLPWAKRTTDSDGSVTLRLAPGRARIDVGGLVRTEAEVRADDMTEVRVTLPR